MSFEGWHLRPTPLVRTRRRRQSLVGLLYPPPGFRGEARLDVITAGGRRDFSAAWSAPTGEPLRFEIALPRPQPELRPARARRRRAGSGPLAPGPPPRAATRTRAAEMQADLLLELHPPPAATPSADRAPAVTQSARMTLQPPAAVARLYLLPVATERTAGRLLRALRRAKRVRACGLSGYPDGFTGALRAADAAPLVAAGRWLEIPSAAGARHASRHAWLLAGEAMSGATAAAGEGEAGAAAERETLLLVPPGWPDAPAATSQVASPAIDAAQAEAAAWHVPFTPPPPDAFFAAPDDALLAQWIADRLEQAPGPGGVVFAAETPARALDSPWLPPAAAVVPLRAARDVGRIARAVRAWNRRYAAPRWVAATPADLTAVWSELAERGMLDQA